MRRVPALPWDHDARYRPLLLRELPRPRERVLEVGRGAGEPAAVLAGGATRVDAVDRSPERVAPARARVPAGVSVTQADRPRPEARAGPAGREEDGGPPLPLEEALRAPAAAVRPGGVPALVALPAPTSPRELPVEVAAAVRHRLIGLGRWMRRRRDVPTPGMPVRDPARTVREVRRRAAAVLPGVRVRRLPSWRYLLVRHRPGG